MGNLLSLDKDVGVTRHWSLCGVLFRAQSPENSGRRERVLVLSFCPQGLFSSLVPLQEWQSVIKVGV